MLGNYSKFLSNDLEVEMKMVSYRKMRNPLFAFPLNLRQYCQNKDFKSGIFASTKAIFKHLQKSKYLLRLGVTCKLKFLNKLSSIHNYLYTKS